jgi:thymidylate synthase (FAD)
MKILKNSGVFEILSKTEDVVTSITSAARTCYQSQDKSSPENDLKLLRNIMARRHEAMMEFADMTVKFCNCSRGLTHELVRHRLSSFAQESTRYEDESDFKVVVPPHKNEIDDLFTYDSEASVTNLHHWLHMNEQMYRSMRKAGWKPEDARQILPTAIKAEIVIKANMREWRHIFKMRCDKFAHWEIRAVMLKLLKYCKQNIPIIFDDFVFFRHNDIEFARQVMTEKQLKEELSYYAEAQGLSLIELLQNLIDNEKKN